MRRRWLGGSKKFGICIVTYVIVMCKEFLLCYHQLILKMAQGERGIFKVDWLYLPERNEICTETGLLMDLLLSVFSGVLIAVMIAQNAELASISGNYHSTVMVHCVGLLSLLLWMLLRREKFRWDRSTRWFEYLGGVFGVITVVACNLTFFSLGVSLTLALGLLGQCLAGGLADHFGLFGLKRIPFCRQHFVSFGLILAGIVMMYLL